MFVYVCVRTIGLHDLLVTSIMKTDLDLRRVLYSQIVLSGGSTLFQGTCSLALHFISLSFFTCHIAIILSSIFVCCGEGFGERLLNEVRKHPLSPKEIKIRIAAPPERLYSTWIGGSILASLATFKSMWVTRKEYNEHGAHALSQKTL